MPTMNVCFVFFSLLNFFFEPMTSNSPINLTLADLFLEPLLVNSTIHDLNYSASLVFAVFCNRSFYVFVVSFHLCLLSGKIHIVLHLATFFLPYLIKVCQSSESLTLSPSPLLQNKNTSTNLSETSRFLSRARSSFHRELCGKPFWKNREWEKWQRARCYAEFNWILRACLIKNIYIVS